MGRGNSLHVSDTYAYLYGNKTAVTVTVWRRPTAAVPKRKSLCRRTTRVSPVPPIRCRPIPASGYGSGGGGAVGRGRWPVVNFNFERVFGRVRVRTPSRVYYTHPFGATSVSRPRPVTGPRVRFVRN